MKTTPSAPEALSEREKLADRITAYLSGGGLVNPELAIHDRVRDLLIDCRDALRSLPDGEQAVRDAARYEWMLDEPEGAQHLLNLLKQKKGTKEDFGKMIDRIRAPKAAALSDAGRSGK